MKLNHLFIALCFVFFTNNIKGQSFTRQKKTINAYWKFHKGDYEGVIYKNFDDSHWETVNIPHDWNKSDVLDDEPGYYRGISWYRKEFYIDEKLKDKRIFLLFEGANQDATVYINGKEVGEHLGGYTSFVFDVSDYISPGTKNILVVKLSNALNEQVPPIAGDLCHFGGIYRDVYMVTTSRVHFDMQFYGSEGVFITYPGINEKKAVLNIKSRITNHAGSEIKHTLIHEVFDPSGELVEVMQTPVILSSEQTGQFEIKGKAIKNPKLWTPDTPHLYTVKSMIQSDDGHIIDEVVTRTGFNWVEADADKGILLNGEPVTIKGVGKHQDYDRMGFAVSNESIKRDAEFVKQMGCNLLRSHYPLDPVVYNACDELGIMVWGKIPILDKITHSDEFMENTKNMMKELMYQNINRPSFILWGFACEIFGDMDWYWPKPQDTDEVKENLEKTEKFSSEMEQFVRGIDPYRLTANDFHTDPTPEFYKQANQTNLNMVNGWNIYQGWYHNNLDSIEWALETFRKYNPDVPFIIAEYGAGSDPRIHTYEPTIFDFSTEYQVKFHEAYLKKSMEIDFLHGMCIWTLFDFQVDTRSDAVPHINSKGQLRSDRTPKDAYYLHQAFWTNEPMVHIAARDWTKRKEVVSGAYANRPVTVFSNQSAVEFFHNGVSLGKKNTQHNKAVWEVPFINGINQLEAFINTGEGVVKHFLDVDFGFISDNTLRDGIPFDGLSINVGQSRTYLIEEKTKNIWIPCKKYENGNFGYKSGEYHTVWNHMQAWQGIRQGVGHDILVTTLDPVYQTFLKGIKEYKIDVPDGNYYVSLLFAEPFTHEARMNPEEQTGANANGERVFDVIINGQTVIKHLDLATQYGVYTGVAESYKVKATENKGISIEFIPIKGEPLLNGVRIFRSKSL